MTIFLILFLRINQKLRSYKEEKVIHRKRNITLKCSSSKVSFKAPSSFGNLRSNSYFREKPKVFCFENSQFSRHIVYEKIFKSMQNVMGQTPENFVHLNKKLFSGPILRKIPSKFEKLFGGMKFFKSIFFFFHKKCSEKNLFFFSSFKKFFKTFLP